jgi:hypothetical protein
MKTVSNIEFDKLVMRAFLERLPHTTNFSISKESGLRRIINKLKELLK